MISSSTRKGAAAPLIPRSAMAWIFVVLTFAIYLRFAIVQWHTYIAPSWDLGIFTQMMEQYRHLHFPPIVDIKSPGYDLWGDHFHPLLIVVAPFYALFPSGLTLVIVQAVLLAVSIAPLVDFSRRHLGVGPAFLIGLGTGLGWGLTSAASVQFHEVALAVPLLAFGLVHWFDGHRRAALIELSLIVFVKEDLGLTLAALGFAIILSEFFRLGYKQGDEHPVDLRARISGWRARAWASLKTVGGRYGLFFIAWGVVWFILAVFVVIPAFNTNQAWDYTGLVGGDTNGQHFGFFHPRIKWITTAFIFFCLGVIGLRSPFVLALIPTLLWRFAGSRPSFWKMNWHYTAVLVPIITIALVDGLLRFAAAKRRRLAAQERHAAQSHTGAPSRRGGGRHAALDVASGQLRSASTSADAPAIRQGSGRHSVPAKPVAEAHLSRAEYANRHRHASSGEAVPSFDSIVSPTSHRAERPTKRPAPRGIAARRARVGTRMTVWCAALIAALGGVCGTFKDTIFGAWLQGNYPVPTEALRRGPEGALATLGTGKRIAADMQMLAYVVPNNQVFWTGSSPHTPVDEILITPASRMKDDTQILNWANQTYPGPWTVVYSQNGFVVLKHPEQ